MLMLNSWGWGFFYPAVLCCATTTADDLLAQPLLGQSLAAADFYHTYLAPKMCSILYLLNLECITRHV